MLKQSGVQGGLIVHLGCGDGAFTVPLRAGDQYLVHGLDTSAIKVAAARIRLCEQGAYGPISVDAWDGRGLPYADNLVNLIVAEDSARATEDELLRVLAPHGVLLVRDGDRWQKTVKPWPEGMDQWTHYFHEADGNPGCFDNTRVDFRQADENNIPSSAAPRWRA